MTAKTTDGKKVYNDQRIYMPYPGRLGKGKEMGRGPYEKSGLLAETSLPPMKHVHEKFEIPYPYKDAMKDGKKRRELVNDDLMVTVKLWYVPFGEFDGNEVIFFEDERKIDLKTEWVWR
ncbi:MAG TPA: hypothetical protein EYP57_01225 [Thermodesulfobacteriaceae bacterium]|nr:hypothetical protein [Thermodesulfobacteriaceae bacterium]